MKNQKIKDTLQIPINSGFGPRTTAKEVMGNRRLEGKIVIATGGYSGIGTETTRVLAKAGATVIIPARSVEKAKTTLIDIPNVEIYQLDLTNPVSIDLFAKEFLSSGRPIHILINGAGIMATPMRRDSRGYESQFSTNHLGHFQLTARLWPALMKAKGARAVVLSSYSHHVAAFDFDDPNFEHREYDKWKAYAQSKCANALFAVALDKRGRGQNIRAFALHPGIVPETSLGRDLKAEEQLVVKRLENGLLVSSDNSELPLKTVEEGAATTIWCAISEQLNGMGGVYCQDVDIAEAVSADSEKLAGVWPFAIDKDMAARLWKLSEKLTGVKFSI
jgi:NAD(P)-dependent dehydrogenase (short-subunit alcohol dehydrogenase family)